jgi:CysZ protein
MRSLRDVRAGIDGFMSAFRFATAHGLGWLFLVPALLWIGLAVGMFALLIGPVEQLSEWLAGYLELGVDPNAEGGTWALVKAWINGARELVTIVLLKLAVAYLLWKVNKYLVLVLLSPLLAYASERTEEVLTGASFPFSWGRLLHDALRGSLVALRNGFLEVLATIALWGIALVVPPVAPVVAVLLFVVSAYFYGFSMFDYIMERRRLSVRHSVRAVNDRMGAVLANGALFSVLMKVPVLGMMLAPVMGAVGAVLAERNMARSAAGPGS